jgi:PTS system nitrogen regulatory IIA component
MTDAPNPFVTLELSRIMTAQEVAAFLQLSVWTVNEHARRGEIPSFMLGRSRRFRRSDLERYIEQRIAAQRARQKAA